MWTDIPNYENEYQINKIGQVLSLKTNKILKPTLSSNYLAVSLCKDGKPKPFRIHQLMAITFLNHKPNGFSLVVDHIDNNKLNNRIENLQILTHRANTSKRSNYSKYTGVSWHKHKNKYIASIQINGRLNHLGYFENPFDAHLAYQNKLKEYATLS